MKVLLAKSAVKQTLNLLPLKMNSVFKYYNVCDDVAEIISLKLHRFQQNEINDHISVMVNWDSNFDYWKLSKTSSKLLIGSFEDINSKSINFKNTIKMLDFLKDKSKFTSNHKISLKDYEYYLKNNKDVFKITSITRYHKMLYNFRMENQMKFTELVNYATANDANEIAIRFIETDRFMHEYSDVFFNNISIFKRRIIMKFFKKFYNNSNDITDLVHKFTLSNNCKFFVINFIIFKKNLINYLNNNGDPRKLTSKTKNELWKLILKK